MKNFKLLLATTAILSTGLAMGAMAAPKTDPVTPVGTLSGESVPVQAKAEIIHARSLSATPLDFGKIVVATSGDDMMTDISVTIDRDGNEGIDQGYAGYILQKGAKGVVTGATCEELNWTEDLRLDLSGGASNYILDMTKPAEVPYAYVYNLDCYTTDNGEATFYGTFYAGGGSDIVSAGEYSGSFTVTVIEDIYPVTTPDDGD